MSQDVMIAGIIGSVKDNGGVKLRCLGCSCDIWVSKAAAEMVAGGTEPRCLDCTRTRMQELGAVGDVDVVSATTGEALGIPPNALGVAPAPPPPLFGPLQGLITDASQCTARVLMHALTTQDMTGVPMSALHAALVATDLCRSVGVDRTALLALADRVVEAYHKTMPAALMVDPTPNMKDLAKASLETMDEIIKAGEATVARGQN